jgi:hypothetical protein
MDSVTLGGDDFEKMCKSGSRGEEKGKARQQATGDGFGEQASKKAKCNVLELPNTTFMNVIGRVPNSNNDPTSSMQFQGSYTDVRHWEELIDFIQNNCSPKEPNCLTVLYKCHLT